MLSLVTSFTLLAQFEFIVPFSIIQYISEYYNGSAKYKERISLPPKTIQEEDFAWKKANLIYMYRTFSTHDNLLTDY